MLYESPSRLTLLLPCFALLCFALSTATGRFCTIWMDGKLIPCFYKGHFLPAKRTLIQRWKRVLAYCLRASLGLGFLLILELASDLWSGLPLMKHVPLLSFADTQVRLIQYLLLSFARAQVTLVGLMQLLCLRGESIISTGASVTVSSLLTTQSWAVHAWESLLCFCYSPNGLLILTTISVLEVLVVILTLRKVGDCQEC